MHIISVAFASEDLLRAESFYGSVLGLPITRQNNTLTIRAGASKLILRQGPTGPGKQHLAFTIPRSMFDSAKQWASDRVLLLRDAEGRDEFETSAHWNAHSFYFTDPEGNILEFIIRRDIVDHRTDSFGAAHIRSISEVGMAVDDVPDVAAHIKSMFDIDTYGSGAPTFQPVGDVEGLLILVNPGRHWFPTATPSSTGALTVTIGSVIAATLDISPGITVHSTPDLSKTSLSRAHRKSDSL